MPSRSGLPFPLYVIEVDNLPTSGSVEEGTAYPQLFSVVVISEATCVLLSGLGGHECTYVSVLSVLCVCFVMALVTLYYGLPAVSLSLPQKNVFIKKINIK